MGLGQLSTGILVFVLAIPCILAKSVSEFNAAAYILSQKVLHAGAPLLIWHVLGLR